MDRTNGGTRPGRGSGGNGGDDRTAGGGGPGRRRPEGVALLRGRPRPHEVHAARPDHGRQRRPARDRVDLDVGRREAAGGEPRHRRRAPVPHLRLRGHPPGGRRRALRHHQPRAGRGRRPDDRRDPVELRPRPLPRRPPRRARLPVAGPRILVGRRGCPAALRGRANLARLGRREDRRARPRLWRERARRPHPGSRPHHRHQPVRGQLGPAGGRRHRRRRLGHHRGHRPEGGAAGARPRLRRPHRQDEVDLPHHSPARRVRPRDVGQRLVEVGGRGQRVVEHERRPRAGLRLPARSARP